MQLIKEKINQIRDFLRDKNIDMWMIYVRETDLLRDPALQYIFTGQVVWESAFIFTKEGRGYAIVGSLDKEEVEKSEIFEEVYTYVSSFKDELKRVLNKIKPEKIAINFSIDSPQADGITHGLFLKLQKYLKELNWNGEIISAEEIINFIRSRKTKSEIEKIKKAVDITLNLFNEVNGIIKPGKSEIEIALFLRKRVEEMGLELAWEERTCPGVFAGPQKVGAHSSPTDKKIKRGFLVNIDFGLKFNGYASDLQRTWYVLREKEREAPQEVIEAFNTIKEAIEITVKNLRPGIKGYEADKVCREYIVSKGYEEYPHATGHQIGRNAHDGGVLLGPCWERYGNLPYLTIEEGMVFTIEPRINLKNYGVMSIEEIVYIREKGAEFLSRPQKELFLIIS